jgi:hypothetical protein
MGKLIATFSASSRDRAGPAVFAGAVGFRNSHIVRYRAVGAAPVFPRTVAPRTPCTGFRARAY